MKKRIVYLLVIVLMLGACDYSLQQSTMTNTKKAYSKDQINSIGLRSGLTREQVISILGRPDYTKPCTWVPGYEQDPNLEACVEFYYSGMIREVDRDTAKVKYLDLQVLFLNNEMSQYAKVNKY